MSWLGGRADHSKNSAIVNEWTNDDQRAGLHYALLFAIYSVYGYQVCPFLEQLSWQALLMPVAITLGLQSLARVIIRHNVERLELPRRVRALFWGDLALFAAGGAVLAFFNLFVHGFPLESGGKILAVFMGVGFYIALDLALERDYRLAGYLSARGKTFPLQERFMRYQHKFALFSGLNLAVVTTAVVLLVYKDLEWIVENSPDLHVAQRAILAEMAFVVVILGAYILRVIAQYSRNMNANLQAETAGLQAVEAGDVDVSVPVTSNDEFGHMAHLTNRMIGQLHQSKEDLARTQDVTIMSLVSLAAKRDNETGLHLHRTQTYVSMLARALRDQNPEYGTALNDEVIELLYKSAPLHDIGKVGVPDAILKKPGRLTEDEFAIMKTHAQIGAEALEEAEAKLGSCSFLSMAREIAATHHEKWDGSGYPNGLAGEDIPLSGRLMAVADVYDALRSARVYKPGFSHDKAKAILLEGKGSHFDPELIDAFLSIEDDIAWIAEDMADKPELEQQDETPSEDAASAA